MENERHPIPLLRRCFPFWDKLEAGDQETLINTSLDVHFSKGENIILCWVALSAL